MNDPGDEHTDGLAPWKKRVLEEQAQLEDRTEKLLKFIETDAFNKLPEAERDDLTEQLLHMSRYGKVLDKRVRRWSA